MLERSKEFLQFSKAGRIIRQMPFFLLNYIKEKWTDVRLEYGILGLAACVAVPLKLLLFYKLVGISANFFLVWLVTGVLTYLLFSSFKKKWIPAVVYLLLSVLMFCDLTYSSFFNRYLSVNMLGAAGVLGDITESIKEVLKPWFFLTLADAALAIAALAARSKRLRVTKLAGAVGEPLKENEAKEETPAEDEDQWAEFDALVASSAGLADWEPVEAADREPDDTIDRALADESAGAIADEIGAASIEELIAAPVEETEGVSAEVREEAAEKMEEAAAATALLEDAYLGSTRTRMSRRARNARKSGKTAEAFMGWVSRHKKPVTALIILCMLVFNSSASYLLTSLSNQEIYSYHIKDILNKLTGNGIPGKDAGYMYAITDSYEDEKDGPLFGVAKGKNLIVIQIESLQNFVINKTYNGQEITPNLNKIIRGNTIYFDRYYQQIGSGNTSDAEFATNNSIYGSLASYTYKLYADNYFRGLPVLLKERGYATAVFHAHEERDFWNREEAYKSQGFDTFYGGIGGTDIGQFDMTEWMGWGLTDSEFYKQAMTYLKELPRPFYSFIITLSNHHPYLMLDKYRFIELLPEDEGTIFGNYLNSAAYTDWALGQLIKELKEAGIYEDSIIAFYGDHLGLPKSDKEIFESVSRFIGRDYDFDTMMNVPLIITVPGADQNIHQTVSTAGGQLDFLPTIAYLMGFESLDTIYLGHNLLTIDSGFVAEQTYMIKGSFFTEDVAYEMSRDGVFENGRAWNPVTGEPLPVEGCYDGYLKSVGIINTCEYILKNDVLRSIYEEEQDVASVFSNAAFSGHDYPDVIAKAGAPEMNLVGTNSLEALNATYDAGYRHIGIDICWTEDKEAVLLSSWKELGKYFDTDLDREITLDEFHSLKMKNGLTSMDFFDLIYWVRERPDVTIYAQPERSADWFMKCMESYAGSIIDQFVAMVPGMIEYSGLYPSVLNLDIGGNTADQLLEFIELNNVPAVSMSQEAAKDENKKILKKADCIIYVMDDEKGLLERKN